MFSKIIRLKSQAKKHYEMYHNALDSMSCGASLGENISSRLSEAKIRFNATMDELAKIDASCPTSRLS